MKDMDYITIMIQKALGTDKWNPIPVEIWYKKSTNKSVNFWTLLTFRQSHYGNIVNFQIIGMDKTKQTINLFIGIPYKIKRARYIGKMDRLAAYSQELLKP